MKKYAERSVHLPPKLPQDDDHQIGWVTITYRSVFLAILGIVTLIAIGLHFAFPEQTKSVTNVGLEWMTKIGNKVFPGSAGSNSKTAKSGEQKANFTMIDGTVRVRKKNDNSFVTAVYNIPLEKGDVVQTGPEGMAKIVFTDKTSYTVKPDSLIVIEENSTNEAQQTQVAVQVTTGTVDLATSNYSNGSKNEVILAGAKATLAPESSAQVRNDEKKDNYEILVRSGTGEVKRGEETVQLANYEKVVFKSEAKAMTKDKEVAPPTLLDPGNMISVFTGGKATTVEFTWTPVTGAKGYKVHISHNAYFTDLATEKLAEYPQARIALPEGQYYWSVTTIDAKGRPSMESDRYRFNIVPKAKEEALQLEIEDREPRGRLYEIRGKTAPGARVMVNGAEIPTINTDGTFSYLMTTMLHDGDNSITIAAQNTKGETKTVVKHVIVH